MSSSMSRITGYGVGSPKIGLNPPPIVAQRSPRTTDTKFPLMQQWLNETTQTTYQLVSVESGTAVWNVTSDDTSSFPITPYVVGPEGLAGYQTIQSALDAANAAGGGMVWVQPGTYTENLTFYSGSQISSPSEQSVTIIGMHTPPASGTLNINRLTFQSATHIFNSNASGTTAIIMEDCSVKVTNGYTFNLPNWQPSGSIAVFNIGPFGTNDGFVNNAGGTTVAMFAAGIGNGSSNAMELSGATFFGPGITINCPVNCASGTSLVSTGNQYFSTFTFNGNSTASFYNDSFVTGATPAITMSSSGAVSLSNVVIKSTNNPCITGSGAGTLSLGGVTFTNNALLAGTLTVAYQSQAGVLSTSNTPGASPQVVNARTGQVIFTDVIANGAYGTLTLTNSIISSSSVVIASVSCSTVNSACSIVGITPGSGSVAFRIYNAGSASTAANILVNFWVMN